MMTGTIQKAQGPPDCYSTHDAAQMVGCTYRQLDYWCRAGLIPGQADVKPGSGGRRAWTESDIQRARLVFLGSRLMHGPLARIVEMLENELALQQIELREALELEAGHEP